MINISYAITVCKEINEIQRLVKLLLETKRDQDQIVILYDIKNGSLSVEEYLRAQNVEKTKFIWQPFEFEGDFSELKNTLTSLCKGDYIFNIDADEIPHSNLIKNLPELLEVNQGVDVIRIPRVNTVEGITEQHIKKWRWEINEKGWINWPDLQMRIYRKTPEIKWVNKVHEILDGFKTHVMLPMEEEFSLYHPKTIDRQERQNAYYDTL